LKEVPEAGFEIKRRRPIFYTNESYVHTTHLQNHSWTDGSGKRVKKSVAKGRRLIMVHAGNEEGFDHGGLLLLPSWCQVRRLP
jgi:hypothetical protein